MKVGVSGIAKILNLSVSRVQQLAAGGIIPKPEKRFYDLEACTTAYIRYLRKLGENSGSLSLAEIRTERESIRKEREKLKLEFERKNLVPRDKAVEWLCTHISMAKQGFWSLPARMSPVLQNKGQIEVRELLQEEIRRILENLSRPAKEKSKVLK